MKKIKLFCFPHAGCSASYFLNWEDKLTEFIELIPAELAGRGMRCDIPLYENMEECLVDMMKLIGPDISEPFAFYGHSSGAIIAYALACKMKKVLNKQPIHIFLSSICPPHYLGDMDIKLSHLSKDKLKTRLLEMGGTTEDFFEDEDLMNFFIPTMLSDMRLLEEYREKDYANDINSNLSIMYGNEDDRVKNLWEWERYTQGECQLCEYKGGHFFQLCKEDKVLDYMNTSLMKYLLSRKGD